MKHGPRCHLVLRKKTEQHWVSLHRLFVAIKLPRSRGRSSARGDALGTLPITERFGHFPKSVRCPISFQNISSGVNLVKMPMTSTESGRTCFEFLVLRLNVSRLNVSSFECTKNNKQAGPDGIAMELFKWMDAENRNFLLNIINQWWRHKQAPDL